DDEVGDVAALVFYLVGDFVGADTEAGKRNETARGAVCAVEVVGFADGCKDADGPVVAVIGYFRRRQEARGGTRLRMLAGDVGVDIEWRHGNHRRRRIYHL